MDEILLILFFILFVALVMITIARIDKKNKLEKDNAEDFKNMKDTNDAIERIIPDNVHADKPTTESTQDIDCKKYTVNIEESSDIEKIVIGGVEKVNEINIPKEELLEDPIQESENPISKLFNNEEE